MEMNGNDIADIVAHLENINFQNSRPHLLISKSTKGLGVSFMENVAKWHHGVPNEEQYEQAVREIKNRIQTLTMEEKI